MKKNYFLAFGLIILAACSPETEEKQEKLPLVGSWKLLTGTLIEAGDTLVTDYTEGQEFIKIINDTHFAFLKHDLNGGQDSTAAFVAGGGPYDLEGSTYTEHLQYCNFREWENNSFEFEVTIQGDTMVSTGIEKIEELDVNRLNIEKYVRIKE
ncbi:hypothetical protein LAG90_02605 [Marinilongibacter aquaticus]|uniref:hypothetical protein n=1 Tax=Marinilongibacter aquaticus TaxID=2975157 RepID=UPI0021BDBAD2|nr:hypothetical protein [Marinilongibacter aquaticus]UBM59546.1 hypothetical protein LAG90_02605 [Marinilongibacter aquaticus]